eukprot:13183565-Alexandrium_andersonii.AAC.1
MRVRALEQPGVQRLFGAQISAIPAPLLINTRPTRSPNRLASLAQEVAVPACSTGQTTLSAAR